MKDYSSIVVSSKIRLLRNLMGFEFPSMSEGAVGLKVLNKLADTILKIDDNFKLYTIETLSELDKFVMHEKSLISLRLIDSLHGAVLLSSNEDVSLMINETDHLCETCVLPGLSLIPAYDKINDFDNQILSKLDIAFDDSIGFMTSNIKDVGTGLKASVKLFLPGLSLLGKMRDVVASFANQGISVSNYFDDLESKAYTFVVCNTETIGRRETDYVVKVTEAAIKISELEIQARTELMSAQRIDDVKDQVFRAWGILTNCYKINEEEAEQYLGKLKMGVALDIIRFKEVNFIDKLIVDILPYSLTKISGEKVTSVDLDKYRATFLTNILKAKRIK